METQGFMPPGSGHFDINVELRIYELVVGGKYTVAHHVEERLKSDPSLAGLDIPSAKTIGRRMAKYLERPNALPTGGPPTGEVQQSKWSVATSDPELVQAGLSLLRAYGDERTPGPWATTITVEQVKTAHRIRRGQPEIPDRWLRSLTILYGFFTQSEYDVFDLDSFVAYAPWRGFDEQSRYFSAVHGGRVSPVPPIYFINDMVHEFAAKLAALLSSELQPVAAWAEMMLVSPVLRAFFPGFDSKAVELGLALPLSFEAGEFANEPGGSCSAEEDS